ncbi:hypothetical protein D3C74_449250 [compost metagenome]
MVSGKIIVWESPQVDSWPNSLGIGIAPNSSPFVVSQVPVAHTPVIMIAAVPLWKFL